MMQLEEDTYILTITNQAKVAVRDRMIELLPEMVAAVQKSNKTPGNDTLLKCVRQIDDDLVRTKLTQILKKYKLT